MNEYQQSFEKLNDAQKEAVTNIEGPVMVIAGPGTGKTQVIASRIAYILENTDANPQNILCLTYTDAGAVAMKNRLIQFIGPTAHDVRISTFHGFCNEVIQENADYFGQKELEAIDDLDRVNILKSIIDGLKEGNPLKRYKNAIYFDLKNFQKLFSEMRKEDLSYDFIKEKVDEYLEEIKTSDEFIYKRNTKTAKKGDFKQADFDKVANTFTKTVFAAAEFVNYQKINQQKGFYDFEDMILWVRDAFKKNDFILKRYQERYQFILVDEYQDTNGSQNEVVELLADYFENPNLFVVGDDDQSIYRFQGANMDNILEFQQKYNEHLLTIPMTTNYRSSQKILDASMQLINRNKSRILSGDTKKLVAGMDERNSNSTQPKVLEFKNPFEENTYIAEYIKQAQKNGKELSKIAVIYRSHKDAAYLIDYLQKNDIPLNAVKSVNILEEPLVKNFLTLLKYFHAELDQPYSNRTELYKVLALPWFEIKNITLANFSYWARIKLREWLSNKGEKDIKVHWRYLLNNLSDSREILNTNEIQELDSISIKLENLLSSSEEYSLVQYFGLIMEECGVLDWIMNSDDKLWNLEIYRSFFDFLKKETSKNPSLDLNGIFDLINTMISEGLSINLSKTLIDKNGVQFLTAHSSKGLEFESVFIINSTSENWNKKARNFGFKFPPNMFLEKHDEEAVAEEESRRLFYVAMTRAEEHLFISYSVENEQEKATLPSKFVNELLEVGEAVQFEKPNLESEAVTEFVATTQSFKLHIPELLNNDWLHDLLEDYRLSVTDMNSYLKCSVSFYYEKVLKIPAAKTESLALGSAVHEALEYFVKNSKDEKRMLEKGEFLQLYKEALDKQKGILTPKKYESDLEYGNQFLSAYYEDILVNYDLPNTYQELHVKARVDGDTLLKGMLDRIVEQKNSLLVYDYKTGKHKAISFKKPNDEKLAKKSNRDFIEENILKFGGEYWRQSVFYSILLENSEKYFNYNVSQVTFEYLESAHEKFKEEQVTISSDDKAFVRKLATETYTKIKNLEFEKGCEEESCRWCNLK